MAFMNHNRMPMYVGVWPDGEFVAINRYTGSKPGKTGKISDAATWLDAEAAAESLLIGDDGKSSEGIAIHKITSVQTAPVTVKTIQVPQTTFVDPS